MTGKNGQFVNILIVLGKYAWDGREWHAIDMFSRVKSYVSLTLTIHCWSLILFFLLHHNLILGFFSTYSSEECFSDQHPFALKTVNNQRLTTKSNFNARFLLFLNASDPYVVHLLVFLLEILTQFGFNNIYCYYNI